MAKTDFKTVDEYVARFPPDVQINLNKIRQTIREAVPEAEEGIGYQMPAFKYYGALIYFSAFKNHYSLFIPSGPVVFDAFQAELAPYTVSKSTVNIPKAVPIPFDLISKMAAFKAELNRDDDLKNGR